MVITRERVSNRAHICINWMYVLSIHYVQRLREMQITKLFSFTSPSLSGPLLKEILGRIQTVNNGTDTKRAYLYSAHDITLVNLLRTMGFTSEYFTPDYGATLVFQLHAVPDNAEDAEIKVLFRTRSTCSSTPFPLSTSSRVMHISSDFLSLSAVNVSKRNNRHVHVISNENTELRHALSTRKLNQSMEKRATR